MFVSFHFRPWPRRAVPRHKIQAHPEGGEAKHPQPAGKWGQKANTAAGRKDEGLLAGCGQGTALLREVHGLEAGVVAPIQHSVLWSSTAAGSPRER